MGNDLEQYLVQKASVIGQPIKATLELTPLCNLKCNMCYIRHSRCEADAKGGVKPTGYWKALIPEMKEMGILFVALIGGEPLLYPGFQELYEELYHNGFFINLTTNGTLFSEKIPDWMRRHPPRYVTVSCYGASETTYERVTGEGSGFVRTMQGLNNLLRAGIPVKLNFVMVPENKDDLEEIFRLKERYQIPLLASPYCFPSCRTAQRKQCTRLSEQECAAYELKIRQKSDPEHSLEYTRYLAQGNFQKNTKKHTEHIYCHAGSSTFWVTWEGNMVPCGMMESIAVKIKSAMMRENWEFLKRQVQNARISSQCAVCEKREICTVCPAKMEAESGNLAGTPKYICNVTDEMIRIAKKKIDKPEGIPQKGQQS